MRFRTTSNVKVCAFIKLGEDISEVLERRSASMVVARIIKPKFVLKDSGEATTVLQASTPRLPIERGLAGPGMLADTLVKRWEVLRGRCAQ